MTLIPRQQQEPLPRTPWNVPLLLQQVMTILDNNTTLANILQKGIHHPLQLDNPCIWSIFRISWRSNCTTISLTFTTGIPNTRIRIPYFLYTNHPTTSITWTTSLRNFHYRNPNNNSCRRNTHNLSLCHICSVHHLYRHHRKPPLRYQRSIQ